MLQLYCEENGAGFSWVRHKSAAGRRDWAKAPASDCTQQNAPKLNKLKKNALWSNHASPPCLCCWISKYVGKPPEWEMHYHDQQKNPNHFMPLEFAPWVKFHPNSKQGKCWKLGIQWNQMASPSLHQPLSWCIGVPSWHSICLRQRTCEHFPNNSRHLVGTCWNHCKRWPSKPQPKMQVKQHKRNKSRDITDAGRPVQVHSKNWSNLLSVCLVPVEKHILSSVFFVCSQVLPKWWFWFHFERINEWTMR